MVNLANKLVNGDPSNSYYQGQTSYQGQSLGNLAVNSPTNLLQLLVNKWFLGLDHPDSSDPNDGLDAEPYDSFSALPLYANGVSDTDVAQAGVGDCGLIASLAEVAFAEQQGWLPNAIENMFINNGDGTYTVRFLHNNGVSVVADYVTVDASLATNVSGLPEFDNVSHENADGSTSAELWVALAEKAYVQEIASGWLPDLNPPTKDSYSTIYGTFPANALSAITGQPASDYIPSGNYAASASQDFIQHKLVVVTTTTTVTDSRLLGGHAYALVGYSPSPSQLFTVLNPWGLARGRNVHGPAFAREFHGELRAGPDIHASSSESKRAVEFRTRRRRIGLFHTGSRDGNG